MSGYYDSRLSADRLKRCYDIAPPRVRQYMEAEIEFVRAKLPAKGRVIELGCGYGRVLPRLKKESVRVFGIDTSLASICMARESLNKKNGFHLVVMNAACLGFPDAAFDVVVCIQNGLSAFKEDPLQLIREAVRITRKGGCVLVSTYAERFWEDRLNWFRLQAGEGLLGEIDEHATKDGTIVCKDGFTARTFRPDELKVLASKATENYRLTEVDQSSLFCEIIV